MCTILKGVCLLILTTMPPLLAAPKRVSFSQSRRAVEVWDFVEVTVNVEGLMRLTRSRTSYSTDLSGRLELSSEQRSTAWLLRFSRRQRVPHSLYAVFAGQICLFVCLPTGAFRSGANEHLRGHPWLPARSSPRGSEISWHFIWEGTGEHYFFNGTTTFWLQGWHEERFINYCIERLIGLKVNLIRVLLGETRVFTFGRQHRWPLLLTNGPVRFWNTPIPETDSEPTI